MAVDSTLPRSDSYEILQYSYRYYTEESADAFMGWLVSHDWEEVLLAKGSNAKARAYQSAIDQAIAASFKLITTTRKSTDPPWINSAIRKKLQQRRGVYWREGRSAKWKRLKKITEEMISKRQSKYIISQKDALLAKDGERNFFKNVRNYQSKERPAAQVNIQEGGEVCCVEEVEEGRGGDGQEEEREVYGQSAFGSASGGF